MIDWYSTGFSALWIFGLGFEVASLSLANYLAVQQKQRFSQVLELPACKVMIDLGMVFFCLGWIGSTSVTWERIVWAILSLIFFMQIWQSKKISNS
jgi:hypothetical protein